MDDGNLDTLRWQLLRCLFDATMDLPPELSGPFIERATSDAALRDEVRRLLEADLRNRATAQCSLRAPRISVAAD